MSAQSFVDPLEIRIAPFNRHLLMLMNYEKAFNCKCFKGVHVVHVPD